MTLGIDFGSTLAALRHDFQDLSQLSFESILADILMDFVWKLDSKARVTGSRFVIPYSILSHEVSFSKILATFWLALGFISVASGTLYALFKLLSGLDNVGLLIGDSS